MAIPYSLLSLANLWSGCDRQEGNLWSRSGELLVGPAVSSW